MARIAGINIPPHQHAEIGLTAIYGIGRDFSVYIHFFYLQNIDNNKQI